MEAMENWDIPLLFWITHHFKTPIWSLLFEVATWRLWKTKNEAIFTDTRTTLKALVQRIRHWAVSIEEI
ncbi:hypothetical protein LINGRAHAP2_LOCUS25977 [Linum grandiflorum]